MKKMRYLLYIVLSGLILGLGLPQDLKAQTYRLKVTETVVNDDCDITQANVLIVNKNGTISKDLTKRFNASDFPMTIRIASPVENTGGSSVTGFGIEYRDYTLNACETVTASTLRSSCVDKNFVIQAIRELSPLDVLNISPSGGKQCENETVTLTLPSTTYCKAGGLFRWQMRKGNAGSYVLLKTTSVTEISTTYQAIKTTFANAGIPFSYDDDVDFQVIYNGQAINEPTDISFLPDAPPLAGRISWTNPICYGGSNGTITINVAGISQNEFTYRVGLTDPGDNSGSSNAAIFNDTLNPRMSNSLVIENLSAGTYRLEVLNNVNDGVTLASCQAYVETITLVEPPQLAYASTNCTNCAPSLEDNTFTTQCFDAQASIDFTVTGGTPPYRYAVYESGQTPPAFSNAMGNTFTITPSVGSNPTTTTKTFLVAIIDANDCVIQPYTFTLNQPTPLNFTVGNPSATSCIGGNDGAVDVTVPTNVGMTYRVELLKGGVVESTRNGITSESTINFTGLEAGTSDYEVRVAEEQGNTCGYTKSVATIPQPAAITFTAGPTISHPTCNANNGTIGFSITGGGSSKYRYLLKKKSDDSIVDSSTFTTSTVISSLGGGTYYLEIQAKISGVLCIGNPLKSGDIVVNATPPSPTISVNANDALCHAGNNGEITVAINGGNNAVNNFLVKLFDNENPRNQIGNTQTVAKGSTYTFKNLEAGNYTVEIDEEGTTCSYSQTITVGAPSAIVANQRISKNLTCTGSNDGEISFSPTEGSGQYVVKLWKNGMVQSTLTSAPFIFSNLEAGTYEATIEDAVGLASCQKVTVSAIIITDPGNIVVTVGTTTDARCKGEASGSASITLTDGIIYDVSNISLMRVSDDQPAAVNITQKVNNQFNITNIPAGTYWVRVNLSNNCDYSDKSNTITINEPANILSYTASVTQTPACFNGNGEITVNASGGDGSYVLSISKGGTVFGSSLTGNLVQQVPPGRYTIRVRDGGGNGCTKTTFLNVANPPQLSVNQTIVPVTCAGDLGRVTFARPSHFSGAFTYRKEGDPGFSTQNTYDLPAGVHTFYVRQDNNCETSFTVTIDEEIFAAALANVTDLTCINGNDGQATLNLSGGVPPYEIKLNNGTFIPGNVISGITNSANTITVRDSQGCTIVLNNVTAADPPSLVVTLDKTEAACEGKSSASAAATGQSGNYTFEWFKGAVSLGTGATIANLNSGADYKLVVTDNVCGTTEETPFTIVLQSLPTATLVSKTTACTATSPDATATISVNSTTANPVTVLWDNGQTTLTATGLSAGNHTVTLIDAKGCIEVFNVEILQQPTMVIEAEQRDVCYDQNGDLAQNGLINITNVQNRIAPTTYQWQRKNSGGHWFNLATTGTSLRNLSAGEYRVIVTNAKGCEVIKEFTINNPGLLVPYSVATSNVCFGQSQGSVTITFPGNFQYSLDGFNYQPEVTNETTFAVNSTEDTLYIKNAVACVVYPINIEVIPQVNLSVSENLGVSCIGGSDAVVKLNATGGLSGSYLYSRFPDHSFTTNSDFAGLSVGTYTFYAQRNGCTTSIEVTVPQRYAALTATLNQSIATTCGNNDGRIELNITGGKSPYDIVATEVGVGTVVINNNSNQVNGLNSGYHNLIVTDDAGCTVRLDSVLVRSNLIINLTTQDAQCGYETVPLRAGSVNVNVSNGLAPYTYEVYDAQNNLQVPSSLAPGEYRIVVRDNNNCRGDASFTIGLDTADQPTMTVQSITPTSCASSNDGTATITVTSALGAAILWDNGQTTATATGLSPGDHTVTLTDLVGCSVTNTVNIPVADPMVITAASSINPSCLNGNDGSIEVNVTQGNAPYTYNWSNGQTSATATGLVAGSYTVMVTDQSGCQQSETFILSNPSAALHLALIHKTPVTCNGGNDGTIELVASGGWPGAYEYSEDGTNYASIATTTFKRENLTTGSHTFYVRDANGCVASLTETFNNPTSITMSIVAQTANTCNGSNDGTVTLSATGSMGNFTFSKNALSGFSTNPTLAGLAAGPHWLYAKSNGQCLDSIEVTITEPNVLTATVSSLKNVTCNGGNDGRIMLDITGGNGGYKVSVDGSNFTTGVQLNGLTAGTYTITVQDAQGCEFTLGATQTLTEPTAIQVNLVTDPVACATGKTKAEASASGGSGGYTYAWFDATDAPVGSGTELAGIVPGNYKVVVTDSKSCRVEQTFSITANAALPDLNILSTTNASCSNVNDGSATIEIVGGIGPVTVLWEVGGQTNLTATNLPAGNNKVTLTDANGCSVDKIVAIGANPDLVINTELRVDPTCAGAADGRIEVGASNGSGNYSFAWSNGQNGKVANNLMAGTSYTVTVTDNNLGCVQTQDFTLNGPSTALTASLVSKTDETCRGNQDGTAFISASGGWGGPYLYSRDGIHYTTTAAANYGISNLKSGSYIFYVQDSRGCVATTNVITINAPATFNAGVINQTNVACNGDGNTGSVTLAASGTGAPFTFSDNMTTGFTTNPTFNNLTVGNHTFYVKNSSQCIQVVEAMIVEPAVLTVTENVGQTKNVSCKGGNDGEVTLNISGGTAPYKVAANGSRAVFGNTATGLVAGSNNITVEDANGCSASILVNISEPANTLLVSLGSKTNTTCGLSNGSLSVNVAGGTSPYTYQWQNSKGNILGSTGATLSSLGVEVYTVTVTDVLGCVTTFSESIIAAGGPDANIVSVTDASCNTVNDGTATIDTPTGVGTITVLWDNGQTTLTATNLSAGAHTVTLTDGNGCQTVKNVTIGTKPALTFETSLITTPRCSSGCDGSIQVNVTNGSGNFSYLWDNGQTGQTRTNLCAGNYSVTVTDVTTGCAELATFEVANPQPLRLSLDKLTLPSCIGETDGQIQIVASGGMAPYTYQWTHDASETNANLTNIAQGAYEVVVTDAQGCTNNLRVFLNDPFPILASVQKNKPTCNTSNDGSLTVNATGGAGGYSYRWTDITNNEVGTTATLSGIEAGRYRVAITDANGCVFNFEYTLDAPMALSISALKNPTCNGDSDGEITVAAQGGTPPYNYSWSNGQTGATAVGLSAGTYTVTITDGNACANDFQVVLGQPEALGLNLVNKTETACGNNASATVEANGGAGSYAYVWRDQSNNVVSTEATATGLSAGTYQVTATDAGTCQTTLSVTLNPKPLPSLNVVSTTAASCGNDGTATIEITQGVTPVSVTWPNGLTSLTGVGLSAGTQLVTLTDAMGCSVQLPVVIPSAPAMHFGNSSVTPLNCNGDATAVIEVQVNNGTAPYTYEWLDGAAGARRENLSANTYTLYVTDAKGCRVDTSFVIADPAKLQITATTNDPQCFNDTNGAIDVQVTGGSGIYTYSWDHGANASLVTGLAAGTYTVTVNDSKGCTTNQSFTLVNPPQIIVNVQETSITCNGGTGKLTVTNPSINHTYQWGSATNPNLGSGSELAGINAGVYTLTITDASGCQSTITSTLTEPDPLVLAEVLSAKIAPSCLTGQGQAEVSVTGGSGNYQYFWFNASGGLVATTAQATGLGVGTYNVEVRDQADASCTANIAVVIQQASEMTFGNSVVNGPTCTGDTDGMVELIVTNGVSPYTYSWNIAATTNKIENLAPGTYTVTVTDALGCTKDTAFTLVNPVPLQVTENITQPTCGCDGEITLDVTGGTDNNYTYQWAHDASLNASNLTNLCPGNYTVTVTDKSGTGCSIVRSITLASPTPFNNTINITDATCFGASTGKIEILSTTGGNGGSYSYAWKDALGADIGTGQSLDNLASGTYYVTVTDNKGCNSPPFAYIVGEPGVIVITQDLTNSQNPACAGESNGRLEVNVTGGTAPYTLTWSNGQTGPNTSVTGLAAGTHWVVVTDVNNCVSDTSYLNLTDPLPIEVTVSTTGVACNLAKGTVTANATNGSGTYHYQWFDASNNLVGSGASLNGLVAGNYRVVATDVNGNNCAAAKDFTIETLAAPMITTVSIDSASCTTVNNGSATIQISGVNTAIKSIVWDDGQTGLTATGLEARAYTIRVIDQNDCEFTHQVTIPLASPIVVNEISQTSPSCPNACDGKITVEAQNGSGNYTYNWVALGKTGSSIDGVCAGTYKVTVQDNNTGCTTDAFFTIAPPTPIQITGQTISPTCIGGNNGVIEITASNGAGGYQYSWAHDASLTTTRATGLTANVAYTVTVTDANGCAVSQSFTINNPALLTASIGVKQPGCSGEIDGELVANLENEKGTLSYRWTTLNDTTQVLGTNAKITGLGAGTYVLTVTDQCTTVKTTATLTDPRPLSLIEITADSKEPTCNGGNNGRRSVLAIGGRGVLTYRWSNGETGNTASRLNAGTYRVTVTDEGGCSVSRSFVVNNPAPEVIDLPKNVAICPGQQYFADPGNIGVQYTWRRNGTVISTDRILAIREGGTYELSVVTFQGCNINTFIEVTSGADAIKAEFALTDKAVVGDTVVAIELSLNIPERIEWTVSGTVEQRTIVPSSEDYELLVFFREPGVYNVTLYTFTQTCQDSVSQTIEIFSTEQEAQGGRRQGNNEAQILHTTAYPNPTNGQFKVAVKLNQPGPVEVTVINPQNFLPVLSQAKSGDKEYVFDLNLSNATYGVYYVNVKTGESTKTIKVSLY